MADEIHISVKTQEAAARLEEDFEEVIARVNGDLMGFTIKPNDPISVEAAIAFAERAVDHHLRTFADNAPLQSLAPEIKLRFRRGIEDQARNAGKGK